MADAVVLDLDDLSTDIPALTAAMALRMQEAVVMCMEPHGHSSGVSCELRNLDELLAGLRIQWKMSYSERIRRAFGESRNAAEQAGEAIAILVILRFTDFIVIERARIGSGFDFWLSRTDEDYDYLFQHEMGLEAKGLSHARYPSDITEAIKGGIAQIANAQKDQKDRDTNAKVPGLIVATDFSRPTIYMVRYEPQRP